MTWTHRSKDRPTKSHIVVVEDEEHLAKGIKFNLEADGYRVTTFDNGAAALELICRSEESVDLVILDLMLPGMSGYAVCEKLRDQGQEMPVLILSARTLTEDRTRGFDVGADQYLTKPFELDELLSRVKGLLVRHGRRRLAKAAENRTPKRYEIGPARVNFEAFEVEVNGKTNRLTALEMKLLQYLIENEGRIVSRQDLLEDVWDQPGYLHTRAPDQFIRRLRKVFEPDPSNPQYFLTIRDAGYRFVSKPEREEI